ncbi:MAG: hypothetical protein QOD98_1256 [Nocardioidaceae bacterium]|jgi:hypothetical protein|nr:hypothetical protein [Nocardioidaceae bacterium]
MPVVVLLVVVAASGLFALAWWSSGRSKGLGRGNRSGDAAQDSARLWANVQKTTRNESGGSGGGGLI